MTNTQNVIQMKEISKFFPGVVALEKVDFELKKGEIHALVGENGAGKSTLIKVLTGVEQPDQGSIELNGKPLQVRSPQHSQELGISTVYQEINLCTNIPHEVLTNETVYYPDNAAQLLPTRQY